MRLGLIALEFQPAFCAGFLFRGYYRTPFSSEFSELCATNALQVSGWNFGSSQTQTVNADVLVAREDGFLFLWLSLTMGQPDPRRRLKSIEGTNPLEEAQGVEGPASNRESSDARVSTGHTETVATLYRLGA